MVAESASVHTAGGQIGASVAQIEPHALGAIAQGKLGVTICLASRRAWVSQGKKPQRP
jgi:hypothetical protein